MLRAFGITPSSAPDLSRWSDIMDRLTNPKGEVTVGVVGKYVGLQDAYKSLNEALVHGGIANRVKVNVRWIDAELFENDDSEIVSQLEPCDSILVPARSVSAARRARSSRKFPASAKSPISASASACRWPASKARAIPRASPMPRRPNSARRASRGRPDHRMDGRDGLEQREASGDMGGTMRLGAMKPRSTATASSRRSTAARPFRTPSSPLRGDTHYKDALEKGGLVFSGMSPDGTLPEIVERPDHPLVRRRAVPPGAEEQALRPASRCSPASSPLR